MEHGSATERAADIASTLISPPLFEPSTHPGTDSNIPCASISTRIARHALLLAPKDG